MNASKRQRISKDRILLPALVVALVVAITIYNNARDSPRHYLLRRALVSPKLSGMEETS